MANLPTATVTIDAEAGALAGGTGYCVVLSCVERNADLTPRVYTSHKGILAQHGYSQGASYAAAHIEETKKPVIFVARPTAVAGTIVRQNASGVAGTSVISVAAGVNGVLDETDAIVTVDTGGTIGEDGIVLDVSFDGGQSSKKVPLKTAASYTPPYLGIVISFAAGTLVAGDVYTFKTTPPMWDGSGLADARTALAAQTKPARTWLITGDLVNVTQAGYVTTQANAYATSNDRFTLARVSLRDRLPLAELSRVTVRMTGAPTITFAEVGSTGDTITRSTGSFISDGFVAGMVVTVSGAVAGTGHNNITGKITNVTALVLTLDTADLDAEGPISGVDIVGSYGLVFTTTTATRSGGSWLTDGFRVGDSVTFTGTSSNNITVVITVLTATVMTFASGGSAETIGTRSVTAKSGETMAAWVSSLGTTFATVDGEPRIDMSGGRLRRTCPITGWSFRRPTAWGASVREYQYDVHVPTWMKEKGPLKNWSMTDSNGRVVEYDERTDGGLLAARITCARTWSNGPSGAFIAQSLTRADENTVLSMTHNMHVANVACGIIQAGTENFIGKHPVLDDDGHMIATERTALEESVNSDLAIALLQEKVAGQGQRASKAVWTADTDDVLNVPDATVNGVLELHVNGTVVHVNTLVKVS